MRETITSPSLTRRRALSVLLAISFVIGGLIGCGKTGPLRYPDDVRPMAIQTLAAEVSGGRLLLSWSRPERNMDGTRFSDPESYHVFRAEGSGQEFERVGIIVSPEARMDRGRMIWADESAIEGVEYRYQVQVRNSLKVFSRPSNIVTAVREKPLPAVGDLRGVGGDGEARLLWRPVAGASGYRVYRSMSATGTYRPAAEGVIEAAEFRESIPSTAAVYYKVQTVGPKGGLGFETDPVRVSPRRAVPPARVEGLQAISTATSVYLSWDSPAGAGVSGYRVCRSTAPDVPADSCWTVGAPSFSDMQPPLSGAEIFYRVSALDDSSVPVEGPSAEIRVRVGAP